MGKEITEELYAAQKALKEAQEDTRQAKNKEAIAKLNVEIAKLAGNPALFIPLADLSKYGTNLSASDQKQLKNISPKLKGKHFFLGELAFESKKLAPKDLGITAKDVAILSRLMRQNNFDFDAIPHYNLQQEIGKVRKKNNYVGKAGTGERDAVRAHLLSLFNSKNFSSLLTVKQISQPDQTGSLTATFNISAELMEEINEAKLTNGDVAELIDYTFNRAVIREYLKDGESKTPTDKALDKYRCKNPVRVKLEEQSIKVTIPLSQTVKGPFRDGHITPETFETAFTQEMNMGIQLALLQKQTRQISNYVK